LQDHVAFFIAFEGRLRAFTREMGHMTLTKQHLLHNHDFVRGLPAAQIDRLASLASEVIFNEDEVILVEGQLSSAFYLLLSGSVSIELRTPRYSICVDSLGPGRAFGWSALLDHQDTLFQVRARETTTVLCLEGAALKSLCRTDPDLGIELLQRTLQLVAGRVKATEIRFAEMCGVRV
jgi:CRP/FNR family cyclic AMP-dependent transcriptional regulator